MDGRGVARHDVGPVREPGDAAETLCFALGDEAVLCRVQAFELRILLRHDARHRLEGEGVGNVADREAVAFRLVLVRSKRFFVDGDRDELELVAVEDQVRDAFRRAAHGEPGGDDRVVRADVHVEIDRLHDERRRAVVLELDGFWQGFFHAANVP
jgi:hypothetical protein